MTDTGDYWRDIKEASRVGQMHAARRHERKMRTNPKYREKFLAEIKKNQETSQANFDKRIKEIEDEGFTVKVFTETHLRINNRLDLFNFRYHDITSNKRGDIHGEEVDFIKQYFAKDSTYPIGKSKPSTH